MRARLATTGPARGLLERIGEALATVGRFRERSCHEAGCEIIGADCTPPVTGVPDPIVLDPAFTSALADILAARSLLTAAEDTRPYECDALTLYRELPAAVVLPESEDQVIRILKLCHEARVPVVARGAGTSLSGGSMPDARGIVLSLAKFSRILAIDPVARTAVVEPGVRNLAISEAASAHGLFYAPDPSSQIACSIGGNVAENAGGVHCLKYGLTVHNLRKVRAVLVTGEIVEFGADALDARRIRPPRTHHRQRGSARRYHADHRQAAAEAEARASCASGF